MVIDTVRPVSPLARVSVRPVVLGKHWNTCWICGTQWPSPVISDDCGANDQVHRDARGG